MQQLFPVNSQGLVIFVKAATAVGPFTYSSGLKYDATGAVVIA